MNDAELIKTIKAREAKCKSYEDHNEFPFWAATTYGARGFTIADGGPSAEDSYYDIDKLPTGCPFPSKPTPDAMIDTIWAPIEKQIPKFVAALRKATKQILVYHRTGGDADRKNQRGWFLGYFLDRKDTVREGGGRYADMWGREPFHHPKLSKKLRKTGYKLPASLRQLYSVHNGIGLSTARTGGVEAIYSAKNLELLPRRPDLVDVYCDSGGNRATFPLSGEDHLVDWDRQTHETARIGSIWKLLESEGVIRYVTGEW